MKFFIYLLFIAFTVTGSSPRSGNSTGDRVAAVVNGVEITNLEVNSLYQRSTAASGLSRDDAREQKRAASSL